MTILILAVGSYGDVLPLVGMARELQQRGHTVTVFTSAHFTDLVQKAGVEFVGMGTAEDYDAMANNPALWHPHKGWRLIMKRLVSSALEETYTSPQVKGHPGKHPADQLHPGVCRSPASRNPPHSPCHRPFFTRCLPLGPPSTQNPRPASSGLVARCIQTPHVEIPGSHGHRSCGETPTQSFSPSARPTTSLTDLPQLAAFTRSGLGSVS